MKIIKIRNFEFIAHFILYFIPLVFFLLLFLFYFYNFGVHIYDLVLIAVILPLTFFLVFVINYYLYDKDTTIKIDENGFVIYINVKQVCFYIQDIDVCTESCARFPIGYTEITLKDGYSFYVSNFISLEPIYKMNPNIKRENLAFFRPKILRRNKFKMKI